MTDTVRFISANGLRFGYLESGRGPLVLLVHGFPDMANTWDDVRPRIAARVYRVVAPFLRGYHPTGIPARDTDARTRAAYVTFEPCARSDWHTHPLGQTPIVTFGCGLHQRWGGPIEEIRPGDVITVGPNEKHWHGASPTTAMTHMALQESLDGKAVEWLEKVTDDQCRGTA